MLLFDASHTSHTRAQTGIQRVTRSLFGGLTQIVPTTAICFDPYLRGWRPLDRGELACLRPGQAAAGSRGAKWPLQKRVAGFVRRLTGAKPSLPPADGLVCPELFSTQAAARLPELFGVVRGPRIAVFHDAIGLRLPELSPPGTVARLPGYLRELLQFDGVAAVSEDSAACLCDYWHWLGVPSSPPVQAIPNGVDPVPAIPEKAVPVRPRVLCVGTIEGRKNHLALLEACESLWAAGQDFELQLLGLARPETAGPALAKIAALKQAGRPILQQGAVADAELHAAYAHCTFTVYPSLMEGFGLPVSESLQHGKPCICSARGALGESAREGGCIVLNSVDAPSLATALHRLLQNPAEIATLSAAAHTRKFRSWNDYTSDLTAWMQTLPRRT